MQYLKITLVTCVLVALVAAPVTIYFYYSKNNVISKQLTVTDSQILKENSQELQGVVSNTNQENIKTYLDKLELDIQSASSSSRSTQNLLQLRKAIILAVNRDSNFGKNIVAATDILVKIINDEATDNSAAGHYISDFAKVALTIPYLECCTSNSTDPYLFTKKIENQESSYFGYRKNGYDKNIAKLLALNDLSKSLSSNNVNDISNKRNQMDIEAKLLLMNKSSLDLSTRAQILKELKENVDKYIGFKKITYTEEIMTTLKPESMYAYSFDIYHQNMEDIDTNLSKKIDQNYNLIRNTNLESLGTSTDPIGYNEIQYYNDLRQLYSTSKRYPKSEIIAKTNPLIDDTLTRINSSKEMMALANNYFHSKEFQNGELAGHSYFASLRTLNKKVDSYLRSIGL